MKQDEENSGYPQQDVRGAILQPDSAGGRRCCAGVLSRPLADSLVRASHWKRARPLAEQLYRRNPDDAQAAYLLSQVKMAFGDLEGALPLAEKAVVLDGSNASYHYQLAAICGVLAEHA